MTDLERLRAALAQGPVTLDRYMELSNAHYYATRDPLGTPKETGGDFTTAPEISQLFGELLGLWAVHEWERLGSPARFVLLELGPGRGTLMADALRAARVRPAFLAAARLSLLEASPVLRDMQAYRLRDHEPVWVDDLSALPPLPVLCLANEFFDALPVRQLQRDADGHWTERAVAQKGDSLQWTRLPCTAPGAPYDEVATDTIVEVNAAATDITRQLAAQIARHSGSACLIDYGDKVDHAQLASGDTLQALRHHQPIDPLASPGISDLTCHVDFTALLQVAQDAGLITSFGTQAAFLRMLGITARVSQLAAAQPDQAGPLTEAETRLTAAHQMGDLFKVLTLASH